MGSRLATSVLAGVLAGAAASCCTSMSGANKIARVTKIGNRLHAEPAMLAAAHQLGAKLLPVFPEAVSDCDLPASVSGGSSGGDCLQWDPQYSPLLTLRGADGTVHQALPIDVHDWYYARLARRGDDLFVLVPRLTRRQVGRRTQCACDAMPRDMPLVAPRVIFVVEGAPKGAVQKVEVPVTEDYVSVDCETYLM